MFTREASTLTLDDVRHEWSTNVPQSWSGSVQTLGFHLDADHPVISLGTGSDAHEVPATHDSLDLMSALFDIPSKFFGRIDKGLRQHVITSVQAATGDSDVTIDYREDTGMIDVTPANQRRIRPVQIAEAVGMVLPGDSMVTDRWSNTEEFRLDVVVPQDFDKGKGWGGDKKVGDLTGGGVRVWQDRKHNLAPGIQPFLYRLVCTNGMEMRDQGMKIDARGAEVEEILASLQAEARRAYDRVGADIQAFYDTRSQKIGSDRTGEFRAMAIEMGLPSRTVSRLEDHLPAALTEDDITEASMFDFINLVTNFANGLPSMGKPARQLQTVGGRLIGDHAERCNSCHRSIS
jgi:hypothetical protein